MSGVSQRSLISIYATIFGCYIAYASALAIVSAQSGAGQHDRRHILALATAEIVASLIFMIRPARKFGGACLVLIFLIAAIMSLAAGAVPAGPAFYACTAIIIASLDTRQRPDRTG